MHAYGIFRGVKKELDDAIAQLQGQYLPFEVFKDGAAGLKKGKYLAQLQVRPIQLYEFVFPKEHKDFVLTSIFVDPSNQVDRGNEKTMSHTKSKRHDKAIWFLRKVLGVKKAEWKPTIEKWPIPFSHLDRVLIGIKEDYNFDDGTEAL